MTLNLLLQYLLPQHILSRLVAKIANCRIRLFKNIIIYLYCKFYHIDMTDACEFNSFNYPSFNAFFTRALKPGARPIIIDKRTILSPVDGKIWQIGKINANQFISAKGSSFTLRQLFADNEGAAQFNNANFAILYLAPSDYHRIHMPIRGKLCSMRYIPGRLFSVNPNIVNNIPDVFAKNERVIITFATVFGTIAVILVGAMIVGSIVTTWAGTITPNRKNTVIDWDYTAQDIIFEPGLEIGLFKLGSTAILLCPEKAICWNQELQRDTSIKMGQSLGVVL